MNKRQRKRYIKKDSTKRCFPEKRVTVEIRFGWEGGVFDPKLGDFKREVLQETVATVRVPAMALSGFSNYEDALRLLRMGKR